MSVRAGLGLSSRCWAEAGGPERANCAGPSLPTTSEVPLPRPLAHPPLHWGLGWGRKEWGWGLSHTGSSHPPPAPAHPSAHAEPLAAYPLRLAQAPEAGEPGRPAKNLSSITALPLPGRAGLASTGNSGPVCLKVAGIPGGLPGRSSPAAFCRVPLPGPHSVREDLPSVTAVPQGCLQGCLVAGTQGRAGTSGTGGVEVGTACPLPGPPLGKTSAAPHFP